MTTLLSASASRLQERLEHTFKDKGLLARALTHRSFSADHNERLEFLGDSVLGLVIADMLYERLRDLPEGDLSRVRANLVRQDTLHRLGVELGLPEVLRLADTLEAIIGAVYLDGGFQVAKTLVLRLFQKVDVNPQMQAIGKDAKTELQEWLQGRKMKLPVYRIVDTIGAAHQQTFEVECEIAELKLSERGMGSSRRNAEQSAATMMLQRVKK